ncbi:21S rRNA (uridine2791-2'-O) methyltransferase [Saccharomycopsis crataegensis]|uniref:rRNA methyltransferase 2, mitochondrial n=1 Tax=Saccharomycopsis crataegensis TaxID=43959 RepID=A0AAV5QNH5_9ASCO|nr:21S rRNA (uridine2791-2'-O) methyltransferase [Saccharomycopsis crataegensis]
MITLIPARLGGVIPSTHLKSLTIKYHNISCRYQSSSSSSSSSSKKSSSQSRWLARSRNDFYTRKAKEMNMRSRAGFKLQEINSKFHLFNKSKVQNIVDLGFAPGAWSQVAASLSHTNSKILGVDILPCKPPKGVSSIQANILSKRTHQTIYEYFVNNDKVMMNLKKRHATNDQESTDAVTDKLVSLGEDLPTKTIIDKKDSRQVVDLVISDMYDPLPQVTGFWNNTTNTAYYRMANTSGLKAKDHGASMDLCEAGLILCLELLKDGGAYVCKFYSGGEDVVLEHRLRKSFDSVTRFKPPASRSESREDYFVCRGRKPGVTPRGVFV